MAAIQNHYSSLPIAAPSKAVNMPVYYPPVASSPPDASLASSTAGGTFDGSSASYAGVDVMDTLNDRMANVFESTRLDTGIAKQAQTSGQLNSKQRELMELQALAKRRLRTSRAKFADGVKAARDTKADLEWTQKHVSGIKAKAERIIPDEYRRASENYPYQY